MTIPADLLVDKRVFQPGRQCQAMTPLSQSTYVYGVKPHKDGRAGLAAGNVLVARGVKRFREMVILTNG